MPSWEWASDGSAVTIAGQLFRVAKDRLSTLPQYILQLGHAVGAVETLQAANDSFREGRAASYRDAFQRAGDLSIELSGGKAELDRIREDVAQYFDPPIDWDHFAGAPDLAKRFQIEAFDTVVKCHGQ